MNTAAMLASLTAKHATFAVAREKLAGHWGSDVAHARCLRLTAAISYLEERLERNESK